MFVLPRVFMKFLFMHLLATYVYSIIFTYLFHDLVANISIVDWLVLLVANDQCWCLELSFCEVPTKLHLKITFLNTDIYSCCWPAALPGFINIYTE